MEIKVYDAFIGEIRIFAFNFVPEGWLVCDGFSLPITEWQPLFAVIGTSYGGNGTSTFNLPNLLGRIPVGVDPRNSNFTSLGQKGGEVTTSLDSTQLPSHNHQVKGLKQTGDLDLLTTTPSDSTYLTQTTTSKKHTESTEIIRTYSKNTGNLELLSLNSRTIEYSGGSDYHENRMPYLAMIYCICTEGEYPQ